MFLSKITTCGIAFSALIGSLSAQGIQFFNGSWADAQTKAKKENKHIFVDAYATWCGPCKVLAKDVFPLETVGAFFNEQFVSVKMDVEKGEGIEFAQKYEVTAMPTLFYFSPDAQLVHKTLGGSSAEQLIDNAKAALDPNKQLYVKVAQFQKGKKDQDFLISLLYDLAKIGDHKTATEVFDAIWSPLTLKERTNPDIFELIYLVNNGYSSKVFIYIMDNKPAFVAANPKGYIDIFIDATFEASINMIAYESKKPFEEELKPFYAAAKKYTPKKAKYFEAKLAYIYHIGKDATTETAKKATKNYLEKYCDNAEELNEAAWQIVGVGETSKDFQQALIWVERAIKIANHPYYLDTKAWLLHKLGKNDEAKKIALEALKMAADLQVDLSATQELIDIINTLKKS